MINLLLLAMIACGEEKQEDSAPEPSEPVEETVEEEASEETQESSEEEAASEESPQEEEEAAEETEQLFDMSPTGRQTVIRCLTP